MTSNQKKKNADALALASLDQEVILLPRNEWDTFVRMLDEPAKPTPALKALMTRKPPWEEEADNEPEGSL